MGIEASEEIWDKDLIYTLVGHYQDNNTFIDLEGNVYKCIAYREINKVLKSDQLCGANFKYGQQLKDWILFEYVILE